MLSRIVLNRDLDSLEIDQRREVIAERVMRESSALRDFNFTTMNTQDLFEMFVHYDDLFFDGSLARVFDNPKFQLGFRLSSRMTSTGGMTTSFKPATVRASRKFEIAVSTTLLFNTTFDTNAVKVGGLTTANRLDALQRIFEHELVHLLEMVLWDDSSCARSRFKSIVRRFFDHLESNHQLLTPTETARSEFGVAAGDVVQFHHRGSCLTGIVNRINRRATILVPDGNGILFSDNKRYQRFYVPLSRLTPVTQPRVRRTGKK